MGVSPGTEGPAEDLFSLSFCLADPTPVANTSDTPHPPCERHSCNPSVPAEPPCSNCPPWQAPTPHLKCSFSWDRGPSEAPPCHTQWAASDRTSPRPPPKQLQLGDGGVPPHQFTSSSHDSATRGAVHEAHRGHPWSAQLWWPGETVPQTPAGCLL